MNIYLNQSDEFAKQLVLRLTMCNHIENNAQFDIIEQKMIDLSNCDNPNDRLDEMFCIRDIQYCDKNLVNGNCPDHGKHAYGKTEVVSISKAMLALTEIVTGQENKYKVSRELLNFVGRNKTFLKSHGKFCNVVYKKYIEFFDISTLTTEQYDGLVESFIITFSTKLINGQSARVLSHPNNSVYV